MNGISIFLKHLFTLKDNETYDIGRVLWMLSVLTFIGLSIYDVALGHAFDGIHFGAGSASVLAGGAGGLALKNKTEKD